MLRKITSVILAVSFIGVSSSGILMMFNRGFLFQLKMHPVHNIFGPLMIITAIVHFALNYRAFSTYYRKIPVVALTVAMVVLLGFLYVRGVNRPFAPEFVKSVTEAENSLSAFRPGRHGMGRGR